MSLNWGWTEYESFFVKKGKGNNRSYLLFDPYEKFKPREIKIWSLGTGGLVQTVVMINSLIMAIIFGLFGLWEFVLVITGYNLYFIIILTLLLTTVGFIVNWWRQMIHVQKKYTESARKLQKIINKPIS